MTVLQGNPTPSRDHGQATAAAAGMPAPLAETAGPGPLVGLGLASLRAYPAFVAELREETGVDLEIAGPGLLRLAASQAEQAEAARGLRRAAGPGAAAGVARARRHPATGTPARPGFPRRRGFLRRRST